MYAEITDKVDKIKKQIYNKTNKLVENCSLAEEGWIKLKQI